MSEMTNDGPTWPKVAAARQTVEQQEADLRDARAKLLKVAVEAVMTDPGAYAQVSRVAAEAGFSDTYLSRALTPSSERPSGTLELRGSVAPPADLKEHTFAPTCARPTAAGKPCRRPALIGKDACWLHTEEPTARCGYRRWDDSACQRRRPEGAPACGLHRDGGDVLHRHPQVGAATCSHGPYGLNCEQFDELWQWAAARCGICGTTAARLVVDHYHAHPHAVRGLLCDSCNVRATGYPMWETLARIPAESFGRAAHDYYWSWFMTTDAPPLQPLPM